MFFKKATQAPQAAQVPAPVTVREVAEDVTYTLDAWLCDVLRDSAVARDLYDTTYAMDYAWKEAQEVEGPGADLDARREAYARFTVLSERYWKLRVQVTAAHDGFTTQEISSAATHQAYVTYRAAHAVAMADVAGVGA